MPAARRNRFRSRRPAVSRGTISMTQSWMIWLPVGAWKRSNREPVPRHESGICVSTAFCGQVWAIIVRASQTVRCSAPLHSVHGYFCPRIPPFAASVYQWIPSWRGSFTTRRVQAIRRQADLHHVRLPFQGDEKFMPIRGNADVPARRAAGNETQHSPGDQQHLINEKGRENCWRQAIEFARWKFNPSSPNRPQPSARQGMWFRGRRRRGARPRHCSRYAGCRASRGRICTRWVPYAAVLLFFLLWVCFGPLCLYCIDVRANGSSSLDHSICITSLAA